MIFVHATPQERAEVLTLVGEPLHGAEGEHTPAVIPDLADGAFSSLCWTIAKRRWNVQHTTGSRWNVEGNQRPSGGEWKESGEERTTQGGGATGNVGICQVDMPVGFVETVKISKKNLSEQ